MSKISKEALDRIFLKGESGWKGQSRLRKPQKPPKVRKSWSAICSDAGELEASTKSEARAILKKMLRVDRLQPGTRLFRSS